MIYILSLLFGILSFFLGYCFGVTATIEKYKDYYKKLTVASKQITDSLERLESIRTEYLNPVILIAKKKNSS
jgi:hypothetical protein